MAMTTMMGVMVMRMKIIMTMMMPMKRIHNIYKLSSARFGLLFANLIEDCTFR